MDYPCPAVESQQSSLNTQPTQAASESVELHGNSSGTGPEEPVSRYPRRMHKPPDRFIDSQHSLILRGGSVMFVWTFELTLMYLLLHVL